MSGVSPAAFNYMPSTVVIIPGCIDILHDYNSITFSTEA